MLWPNPAVLTAGRIALATDAFAAPARPEIEIKALESLYRKLRRWIQARYTNQLACFATNMPEHERQILPVRILWLGPSARRWLDTNSEAALRQFRGGSAAFVLEHRRADSVA